MGCRGQGIKIEHENELKTVDSVYVADLGEGEFCVGKDGVVDVAISGALAWFPNVYRDFRFDIKVVQGSGTIFTHVAGAGHFSVTTTFYTSGGYLFCKKSYQPYDQPPIDVITLRTLSTFDLRTDYVTIGFIQNDYGVGNRPFSIKVNGEFLLVDTGYSCFDYTGNPTDWNNSVFFASESAYFTKEAYFGSGNTSGGIEFLIRNSSVNINLPRPAGSLSQDISFEKVGDNPYDEVFQLPVLSTGDARYRYDTAETPFVRANSIFVCETAGEWVEVY